MANLPESGIVAPSTTMIEGRLTIRAALVNHRAQGEDVDALIDPSWRLAIVAEPHANPQ